MILPTAYFGNIEYFYLLSKSKSVTIDHHEPFQKQTYRSRCTIVNANGLQDLIVPVVRPNGKNSLIKELTISDADNWIKNHIKSIESAYGRSPYFEFYWDQLKAILEKEHHLLINLNQQLTEFLLDKIGLTCEVKFSASAIPLTENDPRAFLSPKLDSGFNTYRYIQTFEDRFGFQNNLSILDLLFNEGPNSITILTESNYS